MARWDPDIVLGEREVLDVVDAQFPELGVRDAGVRHLASGWDNAVWRTGDLALRFVQRRTAVPLYERELRLLGQLASRVTLPIPHPTLIGRTTDDVPLPWFGYRLLDGDEIAARPMSEDARTRLGATLGSFLHTLHGASTLAAVDPHGALPFDPGRRADMASVAGRLDEGIVHCAVAGHVLTDAEHDAIERVRTTALAALPDRTPVLVHGDLHVRHVLVDRAGEVTGIIDWGDACRAPAALDLVVYWALLEEAGRAQFRDVYGPVDADSLACARLLALMQAAMIAGSAADVGRPDVARGAVEAVRRILR